MVTLTGHVSKCKVYKLQQRYILFVAVFVLCLSSANTLPCVLIPYMPSGPHSVSDLLYVNLIVYQYQSNKMKKGSGNLGSLALHAFLHEYTPTTVARIELDSC